MLESDQNHHNNDNNKPASFEVYYSGVIEKGDVLLIDI